VTAADTRFFDAIVLAGGRASRLGGTPKPGLRLGGTRLLDLALDAVRDAAAVAVVGPENLAVPQDPRVVVTREDPPFGGPAAGIDAGLAALDRPGSPGVVVLLAVDIPGAGPVIGRLLDALRVSDTGTDGVTLERCGSLQWLVSAVRRDRLVTAIETLRAQAGSVHDQPVRRLVAHLRLRGLPDDVGESDDVDTWDDLARLEAAARKEQR
jgi:molybdopterin-guanine dinucleotide biosynthesis protein A